MGKVLVTEDYLEDIADSIRSKNGSQNTYTPGQMAQAILDIPDPLILATKNIIFNGVYNATDYSGVEGFSQVVVSRDSSLHPIAYDITNGYVDGANFVIGSGYYSDVYQVLAGHTYRLETGSTFGTLFKAMRSTTDPSQATADVSGVAICDVTPSSSTYYKYKMGADGFITITKGTVAGKSTCLFDVTLTEDL